VAQALEGSEDNYNMGVFNPLDREWRDVERNSFRRTLSRAGGRKNLDRREEKREEGNKNLTTPKEVRQLAHLKKNRRHKYDTAKITGRPG